MLSTMAKCRYGDPAIRCRSRSPILPDTNSSAITGNSNTPSTRASWSHATAFLSLPIEQQDCAQRLALANAYPAELGLRCEALGLPYCKSPEARKAMLRLSRPQTAKKRKNPQDPAARERDL